MAKLKKRSGREEEFNRSKLERSMTKAGAKEETARKVAGKITPREGMSTSEIRRKVTEELKRENPQAASQYESFKKTV